MKSLKKNYFVFVEGNKVICSDPWKKKVEVFVDLDSFEQYLSELPPKLIAIKYVSADINFDVTSVGESVEVGILDRIKGVMFVREKLLSSNNGNINIVNNLGMDSVALFSSSIPPMVYEVIKRIVDSQHIIESVVDCAYFAYKLACLRVSCESYNNSMCILDLKFLDSKFILVFSACTPIMIRSINVEKDNYCKLIDAIQNTVSFCLNNKVLIDEFVLISDYYSSSILDSCKREISEKFVVHNLDDIFDGAAPVKVFEKISYPNKIKDMLYHSNIITNLKRACSVLVLLIGGYLFNNFVDFNEVRTKRDLFQRQVIQISNNLKKLKSIKVDEFFVKNFDAIQCIECENNNKLNINRLVAKISEKLDDESINRICFANNGFRIDLDSDKEIGDKFNLDGFDVFVNKKEQEFGKVVELREKNDFYGMSSYEISAKAVR